MANLEGKDLIQLNATVIAGLLILFTITSIQGDEKIIHPDEGTRILNPITITIRYIVMVFSISSIVPLAYSILLLLIFYETLIKKEMELDLSKMLGAETDLVETKYDVKKKINGEDREQFDKKRIGDIL